MVRLARMGGYRLTEALAAMEMRTHEFAVLNQLSEAAPLSQQDLGRALGAAQRTGAVQSRTGDVSAH